MPGTVFGSSLPGKVGEAGVAGRGPELVCCMSPCKIVSVFEGRQGMMWLGEPIMPLAIAADNWDKARDIAQLLICRCLRLPTSDRKISV